MMQVKTWGRLGALGTAALLLSCCAERYLPVDDVGHKTTSPPVTSSPAMPTAKASSESVAAAPLAPPDTCGAGALQYLVKKPRTEVPVPVNLGERQVTCTTCVMQPEDPKRITILFDQATGLVTQVMCR